ncbi:hypothetical protein bpr_II327 (plasmid) [Butyrivibrio proteoclasticus B316]|uniref:Uncharacterized protein n=1 Tax=Butyrivibrio proteoclasticus (strain ATCC 51982 / DSM 14932 / B316) TaxID=515622 RepID=E0S4D2_BUTPB|nr:hypothetical protein [Butyrivibrio proteoclasticus]ADL36264.1 hypothetical protein bpr_II327 [Butyrivibrio proteoclasticus B316]
MFSPYQTIALTHITSAVYIIITLIFSVLIIWLSQKIRYGLINLAFFLTLGVFGGLMYRDIARFTALEIADTVNGRTVENVEIIQHQIAQEIKITTSDGNMTTVTNIEGVSYAIIHISPDNMWHVIVDTDTGRVDMYRPEDTMQGYKLIRSK